LYFSSSSVNASHVAGLEAEIVGDHLHDAVENTVDILITHQGCREFEGLVELLLVHICFQHSRDISGLCLLLSLLILF